jgi:hypothetical protein
MQTVCWLVLVVLTLGALLFSSVSFALAVFAGGLTANISFLVSHRDIMGFIGSITSHSEPERRQAEAEQGRKGYIIKFWFRIVIIGIVLFFLIKLRAVNIFGLILGLSTVVIAVGFVSLELIGRYYFSGRR